MRELVILFTTLVSACSGELTDVDPDGEDSPNTELVTSAVSCNPLMNKFPVAAAHNIGYDNASCGSGTCATSCPDQHANSDWGGAHHGIDVFAYRGAPIVAVADGTVVRVGVVSATSGLRVRLRDDCGWEYYYGHLETANVLPGQRVGVGQLIGTMGNTGTSGVHLHFNVSPDGGYSNDINPFGLLVGTSPTACGGQQPPPPPPTGCGTLGPNQALETNESRTSCDGRFTFVMQGDGNLVLYQAGVGAIWSTQTFGAGHRLVMQGDGNLVMYRGGTPVWHTGTNGNPNSGLVVQNDGNVVVYRGAGAIWHTHTCCR